MARGGGKRQVGGGHIPRITIVGGRPPEETGAADRPRGIDHVLARAALDRRFRERLLSARERALDGAGIPLSPAERGILVATSAEQLGAMVDGVARNLVDRRSWFARVAGALGVFVGGLALLGETGCRPKEPLVTGIAPDIPEAPPNLAAESAAGESAGAAESASGVHAPPITPSQAPTGHAPNVPPKRPSKPVKPAKPHGGAARPQQPAAPGKPESAGPEHPAPDHDITRGVRPDEPPAIGPDDTASADLHVGRTVFGFVARPLK